MLSTTHSLVSCIMPTYNRRHFVPRAIEYFLRQDYAAKELIVVDDGSDPVGGVIAKDDQIHYIRLNQKLTIGAKRNLACERARGELIVHWDDDDWHAPHRISYQVEHLLRTQVEICGINILLFYDIVNSQAWQYIYPKTQPFWLSGSTLCYQRSYWGRHHFPEINVGEDARFVWSGLPERMTTLPDSTFHVSIIHGHNISPKQTRGAYWKTYPSEKIQNLMGDDWNIYQQLSTKQDHHGNGLPEVFDTKPLENSTVACDIRKSLTDLVDSKRSMSMITVAREADLRLPEFAAFNDGQSLPRMRRWEMPFVLFQSQLENTMTVLDCTLNPVNFRERLQKLYPHVSYFHWNLIQNGQFSLSPGTPDGAFDRVICINTLEHLLRPQREKLIEAMARKLNPTGWLLITADYYFDSAWKDPSFLNSGLLRSDHTEVFNGFNRVTFDELKELCALHGLHPFKDTQETPIEEDASLYRQHPPYVHACMGTVFTKSSEPAMPAGKKNVLALLTWNTKDISIDSVRAYIQEARMLQRLGQQPLICVCDNGSTDGTPAALASLKAEFADIPFHLILNERNLGSSIARNQVIDYMLSENADYLLFMDGDIEIVPFSSFAMLRYMESLGSELGCIGVHSHWQTPRCEQASPFIYCIDSKSVLSTNLVAWTQYGMFRREVFDAGIRFDESGPFNQPGWGFEDNDIAFQMDIKGFGNQYFSGMTYLHRAVHSSLGILRANGFDPAHLYRQRQQYLIKKWSQTTRIRNGPLVDVQRVVMPR